MGSPKTADAIHVYHVGKGAIPAVRKTLELASLILLAAMAWIAWSALRGPDPLPERVATHFDAAGNANAWGSPAGIVVLPILGVVIYCIFSAAPIFRSSFNYPVKVTPENRQRLEALALRLLSFIKVEALALFLWIEHSIIDAMRQGKGNFPPGLMPIFLAVVLGTVAIHIVATIVAGKTPEGCSGSPAANSLIR
jgi:uncharacterized membrane protein